MNTGNDVVVLTGLRVAGVMRNQQPTGFGTVYTPAHSKNGKNVSARCQITAYLNRRGYRDQTTGQMVEGRREVITLTVWNGRNAQPGSGMADFCAKYLAAGKEFTCQAKINTYPGQVRASNGQIIVDPVTNQPITVKRTGFVMEAGSLQLGPDSDKSVANEIARWMNGNNALGFFSRPQQWNVPGTADAQAWDQIKAHRQGAVFTPGDNQYGCALVEVPDGAQLITPAAPAGHDQTAGGGTGAPQMPAAPADVTANVGAGPVMPAGNAGGAAVDTPWPV